MDDPEALIEEARRRQRRRRVLVATLGLFALAAAAAVWGVRGHGGAHPLTVKEIEQQEVAALKRSHRLIVHERDETRPPPGMTAASLAKCLGCGLTEQWVDLSTGRLRAIYNSPGGQPIRETVIRPDGNEHVHIESVDYESHTWADVLQAATPAQTALHEPQIPSLNDPRWVFRLIGSQSIDGQPTLHLQGRPREPLPRSVKSLPASARANIASHRIDLWINKKTYLPVREQASTRLRVQGTRSFAWLPRTKASLAQLDLAVPTGFKLIGS